MRTPITAAAVAGVLLLSGCSVAGAQAGESTSTPEATPSGDSRIDLTAPDTQVGLSQVYDVIGACDAFFGGRSPLAGKVRSLAPVIARPLDPSTTQGQVSKMSNQISSLVGLSPKKLTTHLERIRAPFDQAKQGSPARPQDVVTGIESFKATCAQEGWIKTA
ncbi:hypothetical protein [Myceligenerans pegani]|uniref:Lipoprotein n=1 Tax=Myceligenerans pegani TaxID=2776917 RepID=A0ABR9N2T8_9MICO|nr:hypothetical protein [Myceligenerans sp. TRM 65318]MBE1877968.1 hypothetical protein [Myceligenerans sp. TRM 65318]MBE3020239.1 hypothetical protein [Myceligenerans sp. TRM 65318]